MRIIRSGYTHHPLVFRCFWCGCIFEADEDEYEKPKAKQVSLKDNEGSLYQYTCKCPQCGGKTSHFDFKDS